MYTYLGLFSDLLKNKEAVSQTPVYELREKCLEAFQLSLESHSNKLSSQAVTGIRVRELV